MVEPEKPFACTMPDCGMTFTNEDHLNVHTKKHDMVLQFGCEQKAANFVADQTPTPTRFIRNCEEVGLFQDLQNVNPFDEGFKRAIETKQGILSLEHGCTPSTEDLHTPQMFPLLDPGGPLGDSVFSTINNHRNITISRSSSDETGAIKEFETTRISKLTNEVTTISRIVEKHDDTPKTKDCLQKNSVSYTNNFIKIHSNVEIRKETDRIEDVITKDGTAYDRLQVDVPPIMSQKSIDSVVESLTKDFISDKAIKDVKDKSAETPKEDTKEDPKNAKAKKEDYEVTIKLPSGQEIKLVSAEVKEKPKTAKDLLKKVLTEKVETQRAINNVHIIPHVIPTISSGTLIPVSIINSNFIPKLPLKPNKSPAKRKSVDQNINNVKKPVRGKIKDTAQSGVKRLNKQLVSQVMHSGAKCRPNVTSDLDSRSAASRRYRAKLKETMSTQAQENIQLKEMNEILTAENTALKKFIMEHMKKCPSPEKLSKLEEEISSIDTND